MSKFTIQHFLKSWGQKSEFWEFSNSDFFSPEFLFFFSEFWLCLSDFFFFRLPPLAPRTLEFDTCVLNLISIQLQQQSLHFLFTLHFYRPKLVFHLYKKAQARWDKAFNVDVGQDFEWKFFDLNLIKSHSCNFQMRLSPNTPETLDWITSSACRI